ncbi:MAG: BatA and WFA domain-containing protein [Planctomycetota bacterium]
MSFLNPVTALIAAGLTVPLLVSLYFLKLRRRPVEVPSTLLWKKAIQDLQVNAPFQRIRNNLLLWLQLLLLALLLIAMARPTQRSAVSPGERVVIVVDRSASMNTSDASDGQTRLEKAKGRALELIDSLDEAGDGTSGGGAMVVTFAERAAVVQAFTNDRGLLRSAVRSIEPTDQRGRFEPALGLIAPFSVAEDDETESLTVYVFSDGRVQRDTQAALALPGATLAFERLGEPDTANVGIVAASARRSFENPAEVGVFARFANTGPATRANVTLKVDGRVVRTRALSLPAADADGGSGEASLTFDLSLPGGATLEVTHDQADALPADDTARLQLVPAKRLRVMLVTEGNRYLRGAVRAAGARDLILQTPTQYEAIPPEVLRDGDGSATGANAEGFDLVVFDRYSPALVPSVSSLSFGAAPPIEGLSVRPSAEDAPGLQAVLTWQRDHPLMQYVVLDDVTLRRPGRLTVPLTGKVLAVGLAGPLIAETRVGNTDHVAVSFDVLESRWPHHWSFQVFMVNALEVLGLGGGAGAAVGEAALAFRTGETATVPVPASATAVGYRGPTRLSATARRGSASLPAFTRVGFYEADVSVGVEPPFGRLPVNLLDATESDVRPVDRLDVGTGVTQATSAESLVRREVWWWFAWAALGLLLVEWFVYMRRMRV